MTTLLRHNGNSNWVLTLLGVLLAVVVCVYWTAPFWIRVSSVISDNAYRSLAMIQQQDVAHERDEYKLYFNTVVSVVFGRSTLFDTFVISTDDHVPPNTPVFFVSNSTIFFIGETNSLARTSGMQLVNLISRADDTRLVRISGVSEAVSAIGRGNGVLSVELPMAVQVSDRVGVIDSITGYPIGFVHGIDSDPRDPTKTVFITLPMNPRSLTIVGLNPR